MHGCDALCLGGFRHRGAVRTVSDQKIHACLPCPDAGVAVTLLAGRAKLQHIAQQGNFAGVGQFAQDRERRPHTVGAGVVAVLNDRNAVLFDNVLAHPGGLIPAERGGAAGGIQPQTGGGGVGCQRIVHGVAPHGGDAHGKAAVFGVRQRKAGAACHGGDILCADIGGGRVDAEPYGVQPLRHLGGGQQVVVRVQHKGRTVGQPCADLHLRFQYILPRAEIFQMGHADQRNNGGRGAGTAGQALNFTRMVHPHFHHGVLGVGGQAEQRVGHADVVVLVALGL